MTLKPIDDLHAAGRLTWTDERRVWMAQPQDILDALSDSGFHECKRVETHSRRDRRPSGGIWQGVDPLTGSVASAVWVNPPDAVNSLIFIDIDGVPLHA